MCEDDVLRELWRIKDELAAECGYDVETLGRALQEAERRSGRKTVSPPRRHRVKAAAQ